ncbi:CHAD domain-containing protein [Caenimonas koreensis DSM 17982]|uniref:CHAD domain-containing protein n=1 Tax=Caenimonas koreensis DSM 17982 TaxID=1121255 RepID=A0A844AVK9_9BURK|nr:CYTH and CHAD domain-containing protein [Caenimonas koreensis]MRD48134.1 CHAD domain-containing protein [Caenimonas koreensis DSM 17982]
MSIEFELKLQVPPERSRDIAAALGSAPRQRMRAVYFDSADELLARHHLALRLRKEGREWVQTAKAPGAHGHARLEHNVPLGRAAAVPAVSLQRHAGSVVEKAFRTALGVRDLGDAEPLVARFETDVYRVASEISDSHGNRVEIAFDRGHIRAADASLPVCEIEFECVHGDPAAAVRVARQWAQEHGLWISTASKALRGDLLARGRAIPDATPASQPSLHRHASAVNVVAEMALHALDQVFANASAVGDGCDDADIVHQLRIGLRRLRVVVREFSRCVPGLDTRHEAELAGVFRLLGEHRDRHNLITLIGPRIVADGGPQLDWPTPVGASELSRAVRSQPFQQALLVLLEAATAAAGEGGASRDASARRLVSQRLARLHRALVHDSRRYGQLDEARQHRVRKRLKRLRYVAQLAASLFGRKDVARYLEAAQPLQDALGQYNDELGALDAHRQRARRDTDAMFGQGWLAAQCHVSARACANELARFLRRKPFWP